MIRLRAILVVLTGVVLLVGLAVGLGLEVGEGSEGSGECPDDGHTHLAVNITSAKTYRVSSDGPDNHLIVKVYDAEDRLTAVVDLYPETSVDVGVPQGGDLLIEDPDDVGTAGAAGSYEAF